MFISCIHILVHSFNETPMFFVGGISLRANCHVKCKFAALKVAVNNFLEFRVYFLTNVAITYHSRINHYKVATKFIKFVLPHTRST